MTKPLFLSNFIFLLAFPLLSQNTSNKFLVTCEIPNTSSKTEVLNISKGTIITVNKTDDQNYQALIICDIEKSNLDYTAIEGNVWRVNIPKNKKLVIVFKCYCLNKGLSPPSMQTGINITNLKIESTEVEMACLNQKNIHEKIKQQSELIFEDEDATGTVNIENACLKSFEKAITNIAREKFSGKKIYNIKYNGTKDYKELSGACSINYDDVISFGFSKQSEDEVFLINLRGRSEFKEGATTFSLRYDLKPNETSRELIENLIVK